MRGVHGVFLRACDVTLRAFPLVSHLGCLGNPYFLLRAEFAEMSGFLVRLRDQLAPRSGSLSCPSMVSTTSAVNSTKARVGRRADSGVMN